MDLRLDSDSRDLAESARRFLADRLPHPRLVAMSKAPPGFDSDLWRAVVDMGWLMPCEEGPAGIEALVVLLHEVGYAGAPMPLLATVRAQRLPVELPELAPGAVLTVAEASTSWSSGGLRVDRAAGGLEVYGGPVPVPWGTEAETIMLLVQDNDGAVLLAVSGSAADDGCIEPGEPFDNEPTSWLHPDKLVSVSNAMPISGGLDRWRDECLVLAAAVLVGTAKRVLELTLEHVRLRKQFDRFLGSFQAVQHQCADAAIFADAAWLTLLDATWRLRDEEEAGRSARVAAVVAARAAEAATLIAAQLHGGVGHIDEFVLPVYFRRAKAAQLRLGPSVELLRDIGREASCAPGEDWWPE